MTLVNGYHPFPANIPDTLLLALMRNANTLEMVLDYALVNRQFFRVFKDNELYLLKIAMFHMSHPAWELREMSPPWSEECYRLQDPDTSAPEYTPTLYLRHHALDINILVKLKFLVLACCGSFLRQETVGGLAGADENRAAEIDDAFWRIWIFCRIFGSGKCREMDITGQLDWLNGGDLVNKRKSGATVLMTEPFFSMNNVLFDPPAGFGQSNVPGLTPGQLFDMTEIWNCFGTLLQGIHGKCAEARQAGVFDLLDIAKDDVVQERVMLQEWIYYVLTFGPPALVSLISVYPSNSVSAIFTKPKQIGLTNLEPPEYGGSRSSFLREAISLAYKSRFACPNEKTVQPHG
jgi:hypothetical protein